MGAVLLPKRTKSMANTTSEYPKSHTPTRRPRREHPRLFTVSMIMITIVAVLVCIAGVAVWWILTPRIGIAQDGVSIRTVMPLRDAIVTLDTGHEAYLTTYQSDQQIVLWSDFIHKQTRSRLDSADVSRISIITLSARLPVSGEITVTAYQHRQAGGPKDRP